MLVRVHGAVLSQAALALEMSPPQRYSLAFVLRLSSSSKSWSWKVKMGHRGWPSCHTSVALGIAEGSCPRWTKIPLLQGKIHFRLKGKTEELLKVNHLLIPWRVSASDVLAVMRHLSDSQAMKYGQGFLN